MFLNVQAAVQINVVNSDVDAVVFSNKVIIYQLSSLLLICSIVQMDLSLVEYPVPININSQYATIEVDSNPVSFDLNDEVIIINLFTV